MEKNKIIPNSENKTLYEITIDSLAGGHSGVDIDKNIPNALKLIFKTISKCNGDLIDINGGERINSIPKSAKAIIATNIEPISSHINMKITKIDTLSEHYKLLDQNITKFISNFTNGVLDFDNKLNVAIDSINLAIISTDINSTKIELSARSMENTNLKDIVNSNIKVLEELGFEVTTSGKYPAWSPKTNNFTDDILQIYKKYFKDCSLYAIHAGLECAIFKEKYPYLQIASIGPDIYFPHSNSEKTNIKSIYKVYEILKEIIKG